MGFLSVDFSTFWTLTETAFSYVGDIVTIMALFAVANWLIVVIRKAIGLQIENEVAQEKARISVAASRARAVGRMRR